MSAGAVLLDTNARLRWVAEPDRIGRDVREGLADQATELILSAASAWVIAIKTRTGRLPGGAVVFAAWGVMVPSMRATEISMTSADAILAAALPWSHWGFFDRMLVAQASRRELTIASSDEAVLAGALSPVLDIRG